MANAGHGGSDGSRIRRVICTKMFRLRRNSGAVVDVDVDVAQRVDSPATL